MLEAGDWRLIYVSEVDLSIDDGPGINEREFVRACLARYPDRIRYVVPAPVRPEVFSHPGIEYVRPHGNSLVRYPLHLRSAYQRVRAMVNREKVDGLVFRIGATPLLPGLLAARTGLPIIFKTLALYSVFGEVATRNPAKNAVSKLFFPMYRSVIANSLCADTVTHTYARWLSERFGIPQERITVVPNGANPDLFAPKDPLESRRRLGLSRFGTLYGYVGAMTRLRHVDLLLRAFARAALPADAGMLLVGGGGELEDLRALAQDLGIGERVVFTGPIPYASVPDHLGALDAAIDVTAVEMEVDGAVRRTSFSQKIPQYLLAGLPVVVWSCDGTEFVEQEGVGAVAQFGELADLTAALERVCGPNGALRVEQRARCRALAERTLSAEAVSDQRVQWWDRILKGAVAA